MKATRQLGRDPSHATALCPQKLKGACMEALTLGFGALPIRVSNGLEEALRGFC
jgi:hypothetical protein